MLEYPAVTVSIILTLNSIMTPFDDFENIMENRAVASFGANALFSIIFPKVFIYQNFT